MHKISQRELLDEGFWDKFGTKIKQGYQVAKEIGKVVLPKTSENLSKITTGTRAAQKRIGEAGQTLEERVQLWMDEQGRVPITPIKLVKKFAGGDKHFAMKIAEKGVKRDSGETTTGLRYRDPSAIVLYSKEKNEFKWIVKPRSDSYLKDANGKIIYGDPAAEPEGGDYDRNYAQNNNAPQQQTT